MLGNHDFCSQYVSPEPGTLITKGNPSKLLTETYNSLLGFFGAQRSRLRGIGDIATRMHGHTGKLLQISQDRARAEMGWMANDFYDYRDRRM